MDIGERIRKRRESLGMTQSELARAVGYTSRSTINKIERDGRGISQVYPEASECIQILDTSAQLKILLHKSFKPSLFNPYKAKEPLLERLSDGGERGI